MVVSSYWIIFHFLRTVPASFQNENKNKNKRWVLPTVGSRNKVFFLPQNCRLLLFLVSWG